ncbi:ceruloplasmin [Denticeps clupeoides]|uniref:Hephaestin n=1 Tax=Denticeps clupeoides TaxID=299321 RepID=A0AAY4BB46_9TELE|nr:ceruloplasmin [Denticeps clupeoides]
MGSLEWTLFLGLCAAGTVTCARRDYFIGIKEIQWDYAPSGINQIHNRTIKDDEHARMLLERGENRIGRTYKKAVYVQYTDASYQKEIEKLKWLGFLGPVICAEEDDVVYVHLKNMASRKYSIHPHGFHYNKTNEGALYPDNTTPNEKIGDAVDPGKTFTYTWILDPSHAPNKDDTNCLTRVYHSHVNAINDISSGLIGPLIICKKGTMDVYGDKSADYLYALMFTVSDENLSWYLEENIKTYCTAPTRVDKADESFVESNRMPSINGYMYGNLPDLGVCVGNKIQWHLFSIGNEADIHSIHFHGQILTDRRHHVDTVSLFPASFVNVDMEADKPGQWLISCENTNYVHAGMQAILEIKKCFPEVHKPRPHGETRQYYIAAEEVDWDYGPTQMNLYSGVPLTTDEDAKTFFENSNNRIGGKYKKAKYVEYTDDTFTKPKERTSEEQHLGILGPVIRAEEEDTIRVTFKNKATRPYTMQPHGVQYEIQEEGTLYHNVLEESYTAKKLREIKKLPRLVTPPPASLVRPGSTYTYTWVIPKGAGPTADDPDCINHLYYSAVDPARDTNSGLVGPLLVCKPKTLKSGKQKNVNKEFHLLATIFDENLSWYLDDNIKKFTKSPSTVKKDDEDFQESNKMHAMNGFLYGNLPGLSMCKNDKVSWHLYGLGSSLDIHGIYFEGNRFLYKSTRRDVLNLFPHISETVVMEPDSMGNFEVVCKTTDHYAAGMRANYTVEKCRFWSGQSEIMLHQKKYYIAAVEVEWDYSPTRTWEAEMYHGLQNSPGNTFLSQNSGLIGSKYKKVVYREYTDEKFTKEKQRAPDEEHLGIMGPMIHAKIGDKVKVVFKNMASRPYSIHAHGVKTEKSEILETKPGETQTYTWYITKNAGPTEEQEECSVGAYYSSVDVNKDLFSGLIGPLVICRRSWARALNLKKEIEEFALLFLVFDENESWYLEDNIKTYIRNPSKNLKESEEFIESNKMHAINGLVYGNLKGLDMEVGDKVYWYLMGMGNEVDVHTAHFHGHSFDYKISGKHRADVFELFPGTFQTVDMRPQYPGTWFLHCHVTDHIKAGMETTYTVKEKEKKKGIFGR